MILESVTRAKRDDGQNMMCNIDIYGGLQLLVIIRFRNDNSF